MLLANFNRKEHLRHRAVSLRQHGFLVTIGPYSYIIITNQCKSFVTHVCSSPWCCGLCDASFLSSVVVVFVSCSSSEFLLLSHLDTELSFTASDTVLVCCSLASSLGGRFRRYGRRSSAGGTTDDTSDDLFGLYIGVAGSCTNFHFPGVRRFFEYRMLSTELSSSRLPTFSDACLCSVSLRCFDLSLSLYRPFVMLPFRCLRFAVSVLKLRFSWLQFSLLFCTVSVFLSLLYFEDLLYFKWSLLDL